MERVNDMDNIYKLIISFIDGDVIEITGVISHEMGSIGDCVYMFVITNICNHYINFSTVKYIGKSLDLKQEE